MPEETLPQPILLEETGSTNDWLRERMTTLADGQWVLAKRQTAGRGRLGRQWQSPEGNLSATCLIRPQQNAWAPAELSFVMALALFDAAGAFVSPDRLQLKWPNDVLLDAGKLSGILLEGADGAIIAGVGVNLAAAPAVEGRKTSALAAAMTGPPPSPADFLSLLAAAFSDWRAVWETQGFSAIRAAWAGRAHPPGTPLSAQQGGVRIDGRFAGLGDDGALHLADGAGKVHVILAGDIVMTSPGSAGGF